MEFRFNDEFKITSVKRFDDLRKEIVLHNANVFNDKNINSYNCIEILTSLIYLLNQGEKFSQQEKENLFFSVTKLFFSNDVELRRIIFLFLKHLDFFENSFILTGTLINEINKPELFLKPNSFRIMGQIVDATSVAPIERLLKNAISNKSSDISSSAILCTLYMSLKGFNIAKPWISEITDKLNSSVSQTNLLNFHTLLLLKEIKDNDKLFLLKTYSTLGQTNLKSQFATCQLIRYIVDILKREEIDDQKTLTAFYNFLESCLFKLQQEAVCLEAAKGLLDIPKIKESLLINALETLKSSLGSSKKVVKYSVLKILNSIANKYTDKLSLELFLDLEKIIDDSGNNATIKAIALSIFLKISKGLSDNRLEKMFKTFIDQFSTFKEDFKREIVVISTSISKENSSKNKLYFNFFSNLLTLEASFLTKLELVESLIWYMNNDKDLKRPVILCLAEYIEDCEYDNLKTKILSVIGKESSSSNSPSQLVRYIYNRIILDNAVVRAAAVSALGEIAHNIVNLRKNIINLIKNSLNDVDNEVRERAFFLVKALSDTDQSENTNAINNYVFNPKIYDIDMIQNLLKIQKDQLLGSNNIALELSNILKDPERMTKILMTVPKEGINANISTTKPTKSSEKTKITVDKTEDNSGLSTEEYKKTVFYKVYGQPKNITPTIKLTGQYEEYSTAYKKIIYDNIVVLDFEITSTLEDILAKNVTIDLTNITESSGFDFSKSEIIEIDELKYNQPKHLFFKLIKLEDHIYSQCSFNIVIKFDLQELDVKGNPHGNTYKDQYKIDKKIDITYSDYFTKNGKVKLNNFEEFWKLCENSNFESIEEKIQLPYSSMKQVGQSFSQIIGFEALNDLNKIDVNAKKYEFLYSVVSIYDSIVFVRLQVLFNQSNQCLARILIRSQDDSATQLILNNIFKG